MNTTDITVTERTLTLLRPVMDLGSTERYFVTCWLLEHFIDPATVAISRPIERHVGAQGVTWYQDTSDGLVARSSFPAFTGQWPAPFPEAILHPQTVATPAMSA